MALGPPIGTPNRWLAGTTDGKRLLAVHTPHIDGVLHEYRAEGATLSARAIAEGVSNHRIGSRELDLAVWLGARLMLPAGDRTSLRCFDADAGWSACGSVPLGKPAIASTALSLRERAGVAVLDVRWPADLCHPAALKGAALPLAAALRTGRATCPDAPTLVPAPLSIRRCGGAASRAARWPTIVTKPHSV